MKLTKRVADSLSALFTGRQAATPEPVIQPPASSNRDPRMGLYEQGLVDAYFAYLERPGQRRTEMKFYDYLETELADVGKALDAFSTMACTGTMVGQARGAFAVSFADPNVPQALRDWMSLVEGVIKREAFSIVRGMAKYGSYPAQLVLGDLGGGKMGVVDLNHKPPATMTRNVVDGHADSSKYWKESVGTNEKDLPRWMVPHFAIWTNIVNAEKTLIYGTSVLKPAGRLGLQVSSCIDGMVLGRLSRAAMRYKIKVDVADIAGNESKILARLKKYQQAIERQRQVVSQGKFDSYQRAPVPDGDFYVPSGNGLAYDVDSISGDSNLSKTTDIELLTRFYLSALGVPPQYLGHGGESGGRSNLSQLDIHFARSSRFLQSFVSWGFEHVALVHMIMGGYDPDLYPFEVIPPPIGARDELLAAQVRLLQSQVVANLQGAGMDPSQAPEWVLRILMGMGEELTGLTPEQLNKLFIDAPTLAGGLNTKAPNRPDRAKSGQEARVIATGTASLIKELRAALESNEGFQFNEPSGKHVLHPTPRALLEGILG